MGAILPNTLACYDRSLKACVIDERFALRETTTFERIASTIIHEATHARLERRGIVYEEKARSRIEAVCLRRELNFVAKLPFGKPLRDEIARELEWCVSDRDYFSNQSFRQREEKGIAETARYLEIPEWLITFLLKARTVISGVRRLIHRFARRSPRQA
jgi:hypothetical protein